MSRIGKKTISIPTGVTVNVTGNSVAVKGPKGELHFDAHSDMHIEAKDGAITIVPAEKHSKKAAGIWGMTRTVIANMVAGVTTGFEKVLEYEGIGYRADMNGSNLTLKLGFSHPVQFEAPKGITFTIVKNTITISGIDKEQVGQVAARIRALKKPEPYKGKGIRYRGEVIRRKAGKKAVASGG